MRGLVIENIFDFVFYSHAGGGITLNLNTDKLLDDVLQHVITELQILHPDRVIEKRFNITVPVTGDVKRIAQLFSNILGNALKHETSQTSP